MNGRAYVGVSGWRYPRWRGDFYPKGLPQRAELKYVAEHMNSAELNGSFYSLQLPSSYLRWHDETRAEFVFAVKGSRYITHMLALKNTSQALANFWASGVLALGSKLGPILWQLPERLEFDAGVLDDFLGALPRTTAEAARLAQAHDERLDGRAYTEVITSAPLKHALEVRSAGFVSREAFHLARQHDVALVTADTAGRWPMIREQTAGIRYVRLHGSRALYASGYTDAELDAWAAEVREWLGSGEDVYVYFDNDAKGHAPFDAERLSERLRGGRS